MTMQCNFSVPVQLQPIPPTVSVFQVPVGTIDPATGIVMFGIGPMTSIIITLQPSTLASVQADIRSGLAAKTGSVVT